MRWRAVRGDRFPLSRGGRGAWGIRETGRNAHPNPHPPLRAAPLPEETLHNSLCPVGSRFRGNDGALRRRGAARRSAWIPAYAGMTVGYAKVSSGRGAGGEGSPPAERRYPATETPANWGANPGQLAFG